MRFAQGSATKNEPFKPKHLLNPLISAPPPSRTLSSSRPPWTVDLRSLNEPLLLHVERRVILTIGHPSQEVLGTLFDSPQLTSSLVIVACHKPPSVPSRARPSVYVLRLLVPLSLEESGASRLVDIFEWALQVARSWRTASAPRYQELAEEPHLIHDGVKLSSTYGRLSSDIAIRSEDRSQPGLQRRWTFKSFLRRSSQSNEPIRPFDAIINFLPSESPDRDVLKAVILVTTVSTPYLAFPFSPQGMSSSRFRTEGVFASQPSLDQTKSGRRWNLFRGSKSVPGLAEASTRAQKSRPKSTAHLNGQSSEFTFPELSRARKARILHLLPPTSNQRSQHRGTGSVDRAHLIRSIESFLLSFYFAPSSSAAFASLSREESSPDSEKARPYVLPGRALAQIFDVDDDGDVSFEIGAKERTTWTLLDLILAGMLEAGDADVTRFPPTTKGKGRDDGHSGLADWHSHRAWISGCRDIVINHPPAPVWDNIGTSAPLETVSQAQSSKYPPQNISSAGDRKRPAHGADRDIHPFPDSYSQFENQSRPFAEHAGAATSSRQPAATGVRRLVMDVDKRLPTPPRETPALVETRLHAIDASQSIEPRRARHRAGSETSRFREHNHMKSHSNSRTLPAPESKQEIFVIARSPESEGPPTPAPSRFSSRLQRRHHDIPTPPDSDEAYAESRLAPLTPAGHAVTHVPMVRRVDSPSHTQAARQPLRYPNAQSRPNQRNARMLNNSEHVSADTYLAELNELEQKRKRSRSQPAAATKHARATAASASVPRTPYSYAATNAPRHNDSRSFKESGRREFAATPLPMRIVGGNALGLRESPLVKAADISHRSRHRRHS